MVNENKIFKLQYKYEKMCNLNVIVSNCIKITFSL